MWNLIVSVPDHCLSFYFIMICSSVYLNEVHRMHSPSHPDLALNVSWQRYRNKTRHDFIEHNETRICTSLFC